MHFVERKIATVSFTLLTFQGTAIKTVTSVGVSYIVNQYFSKSSNVVMGSTLLFIWQKWSGRVKIDNREQTNHLFLLF